MPDSQADQQAAASRERDRQHTAILGGEVVTIRTIQVETDPGELEALERGEIPASVQEQIDRQCAEDEAIAAMEDDLK
jgi:hypothetical protein